MFLRDRSGNPSGLTLVLAGVFLLIASIAVAADVRNTKAVQDGLGVRFEYDLQGEEKEVEVTLSITVEGKTLPLKELHLAGDVGKVSPGKGKRISWDVLRDFPRGLSGEFDYEIVAGVGSPRKDPVTGMEFVFVKGGCFQMGSIFQDNSKVPASPVHEVCIDDFYIGKYEATQGQWEAVMGVNPSWKSNRKGSNYPVENVSWDDTQKFISKLNTRSGKRYRLPTEAEWEYSARSGGKEERWSGTNDFFFIGDFAWYKSNSDDMTHPVGQKRPNKLGIHDMTGNVIEWVQDWVGLNYYKESPRENPAGPPTGEFRGIRGGYSDDDAMRSRITFRNGQRPHDKTRIVGFRLAASTWVSMEGLTSPEIMKNNVKATGKAQQVTGTIESIEGSFFTVMGKKGSVTLKAGDAVKLDEIKVGDKVLVKYRSDTAYAVAVIKPRVKTK